MYSLVSLLVAALPLVSLVSAVPAPALVQDIKDRAAKICTIYRRRYRTLKLTLLQPVFMTNAPSQSLRSRISPYAQHTFKRKTNLNLGC